MKRREKITSSTPLVGDLEADGFIFLSPTDQQKPEEFTISIPFFTFQYLRQQGKFCSAPPKLLQSTSTLLESQANEANDLTVILMKLDLLGQIGHKTFKLSDLFPLHEKSVDLEFKIPNSFHFLELWESVSTSHQQFSAHINQLKKHNNCGAIGPGNENFAESWLWVFPKDSDEHFVLFIQSKRHQVDDAKSIPCVGDSVETEHNKCSLFLPSRHIFIHITNKNIERARQPNEIVISHEHHSQFTRKCLALRKLHLL